MVRKNMNSAWFTRKTWTVHGPKEHGQQEHGQQEHGLQEHVQQEHGQLEHGQQEHVHCTVGSKRGTNSRVLAY